MRCMEGVQRVQAFAARLASVQDRRRDAADVAAAESRRMLDDLNEAAERARRERTRRVREQLADVLDGAVRSSPAAEIERASRAKLAELAVAETEATRRAHGPAGSRALGARRTPYRDAARRARCRPAGRR